MPNVLNFRTWTFRCERWQWIKSTCDTIETTFYWQGRMESKKNFHIFGVILHIWCFNYRQELWQLLGAKTQWHRCWVHFSKQLKNNMDLGQQGSTELSNRNPSMLAQIILSILTIWRILSRLDNFSKTLEQLGEDSVAFRTFLFTWPALLV